METEAGAARLAVSVELGPCLVVPLGIAQGGQRLLIADVCRAQGGNLKKNKQQQSQTLVLMFENRNKNPFSSLRTITVRLFPPSADCSSLVRTECL